MRPLHPFAIGPTCTDGYQHVAFLGSISDALKGIQVTHSQPNVLSGHNGTVRCVSWVRGSGGQYGLVSAGAGDCTLRTWDAEAHQCTGTLAGHSDHVQAMTVAADQVRYLSQNSVMVFIRPLKTHRVRMTSATFLETIAAGLNTDSWAA